MKKIKICTVVTGNSLEKFLVNLEKVQKISEMIELRVDLIKNLTVKDLVTIKKKTNKKSIIKLNNDQELIKKAVELGFDLIDLDILTFLKSKIKLPNSKLIVSYHDFNKTTDEIYLSKIFERIHGLKPYVIKIATMVKDGSDLAKLTNLMVKEPISQKRIILGMGEKGKVTRIMGPLLGNYLTYASTKYGETAPGQIDIVKLKQIYKLIA